MGWSRQGGAGGNGLIGPKELLAGTASWRLDETLSQSSFAADIVAGCINARSPNADLDDGSVFWQEHVQGHCSSMHKDVDVGMSHYCCLLCEIFACTLRSYSSDPDRSFSKRFWNEFIFSVSSVVIDNQPDHLACSLSTFFKRACDLSFTWSMLRIQDVH